MYIKTIYQCEYCKKEFTAVKDAEAHEKKHNPVRVSEYKPIEQKHSKFDPVLERKKEIAKGYPPTLWVTFPDGKTVEYHSDEKLHDQTGILVDALKETDRQLKEAERKIRK